MAHPPTTLTDPQFLAGLDVILQPYYARNAPQDEIADVVQRAESFFLSSTAQPDLEQPAPLAALSSVPPALAPSSSGAPPPAASADPPYPPTFAELAALIASGAPIPGVRDIPDELADEPASEPKQQARRKPWELAQVPAQSAGEVGLNEEGQRMQEEKDARAEEGSAQV
ncbi:hypothetical protein JCM10450v2_006487 [Rhodotorula kratochvilovae]